MTDNLPAVPQFNVGVASIPLTAAPTVALAFALGYAVARPVNANQFAPFCAVVEELERRSARPGQIPDPSEWTVLMGTLPPDMARAVILLYQAQRGQRWAQTGSRHPSGPAGTAQT